MPDGQDISILIKTIYDATGIRMTEDDLRKLNQAGTNLVSGLGASAAVAKSNVEGLMQALGVGSGIGALIGLAKAQAETATQAERLSYVLGTSIEETSRWAYAAERATGNAQALSMGAFHAAEALQQIREGKGKAAEGAAVLGIDPSQIKTVTDLFLALGDAIKNSPLPQEQKLAAVHDILGRSARELYPLLAKGADGMKELAGQADAAGRVIGQSMVDAVKKFKTELMEFQSQFNKMIGLPVITFMADHKSLVEAALALVMLTAGWKTFAAIGGETILKSIGAALLDVNAAIVQQNALQQTKIALNEEEAATSATLTAALAEARAARLADASAAKLEAEAMGVVTVSQAAAAAATVAGSTKSIASLSGVAAQISKMGPLALGAVAAFDLMFALPKIIEFNQALGGLLVDLKKLHDSNVENATTAQAVLDVYNKKHGTALKSVQEIWAAQKKLNEELLTTYNLQHGTNYASLAEMRQDQRAGAPGVAAPEFKVDDDLTKLADQEAALGKQKALLETHDAERATAVAQGRIKELDSQRAHNAEVLAIANANAQFVTDKYRQAVLRTEEARLAAKKAVGSDKESDARDKYDKAYGEEKKLDTERYTAQAGQNKAVETGKKDEADAKTKSAQEVSDAQKKLDADARKDQLDGLEATIKNEDKSTADRLAALHKKYDILRKGVGSGEKALRDEEEKEEVKRLTKTKTDSSRADGIGKTYLDLLQKAGMLGHSGAVAVKPMNRSAAVGNIGFGGAMSGAFSHGFGGALSGPGSQGFGGALSGPGSQGFATGTGARGPAGGAFLGMLSQPSTERNTQRIADGIAHIVKNGVKINNHPTETKAKGPE